MKTTLHNHKRLEQNGKPIIPNVIFKSLLLLLTYHQFDECDYIILNYSLTEFQQHLYQYNKKIELNNHENVKTKRIERQKEKESRRRDA